MLNKSGLRPLGHAVLVRLYEPGVQSSTIAIPDSVKNSQALMETRAEVIEVGSECWKDESQPRAKPGDKVIVTRMSGWNAPGTADGELYRLVNDRDIFCLITEEK